MSCYMAAARTAGSWCTSGCLVSGMVFHFNPKLPTSRISGERVWANVTNVGSDVFSMNLVKVIGS